jgi:gentisate 1,2-dioxygenase
MLSNKDKEYLKKNNTDYSGNIKLFEYESAANPELKPVPCEKIDFDLVKNLLLDDNEILDVDFSKLMELNYRCTSPNLLTSYIKLGNLGKITENNLATSHTYYVIQGNGKTIADNDTIYWSKGDIFTLPTSKNITHFNLDDNVSYLFTVNDKPLTEYLGVKPEKKRFSISYYNREFLQSYITDINNEEGADKRNRNGVLLTNKQMELEKTKTLTPILWSLLNCIKPNTYQKAHRHNSVAIDLCTYAPEGNMVYTLMGKELNSDGSVKDPVKMVWKTNSLFVTPPGWWHSHHNESDTQAWVFPVQDAGLHTYMRTLGIQFT